VIGKVAERRQAKVATIVAAAWALARDHGIGGVSLRALAAEVGMRQPSLYEYFDSKHALFDAMFADGNHQLLERLEALPPDEDPRRALKAFMRTLADFAVEDGARHALLFQRPIPGYEPSPEAYADAQRVLTRATDLLAAAGVEDPGDVDCVVAVVGGLIAAQNSNDPGGDRWIRHLDRLIDLHLDDANQRSKR
jgi:AcrR family transcriptional regulator